MSSTEVVQPKQKKKSVRLTAGLRAKRGKDGWVHIRISGGGSITTVTNNPRSKNRFHPYLFQQLRRTLIESNCWQFGEEGAQIEATTKVRHGYGLVMPKGKRDPNRPRFQRIELRGDGPTASELLLRDRQRF